MQISCKIFAIVRGSERAFMRQDRLGDSFLQCFIGQRQSTSDEKVLPLRTGLRMSSICLRLDCLYGRRLRCDSDPLGS